jgi:hypothetical protein
MASPYSMAPRPALSRLAPLDGPAFTGVVTLPPGGVAAPGMRFGDAGTGLFRPAAGALGVAAAGVEVLRQEAGMVCLGGAPGAESLRATVVAAAANRLQVSAAAAGAPVLVEAAGADSSTGIRLQGKGNHGIGANIDPDDKVSLRIARGMVVLQGVLGLPGFGCGLDYSGSARHFIVGNYPHRFLTDGFNAEQLRILHTAATDRWVEVTGSNGGSPRVAASNGHLTLAAGGTGNSVILANLPTSATGLPPGALWNSAGIVKIV